MSLTSAPPSGVYRDNWDRVYGPERAAEINARLDNARKFPHAEVLTPLTSAEVPGPPTPVVECPGLLSVRCPWCGAKPGEACLTVYMTPKQHCHVHRMGAWRDNAAIV